MTSKIACGGRVYPYSIYLVHLSTIAFALWVVLIVDAHTSYCLTLSPNMDIQAGCFSRRKGEEGAASNRRVPFQSEGGV